MAVLEDPSQVRSRLEAMIYEKLREGPLSVDDITTLLSAEGLPFSRSIGKEISWKLVEEGKAFFNEKWLLQWRNPTS